MYKHAWSAFLVLSCALGICKSDICVTCACETTVVANGTRRLIVDCRRKQFGDNSELLADRLTQLALEQPVLEELILSGNDIVELPARGFGKLSSLRHLDLSENAIGILHANSLENLSTVESLHLGSNRLTSFDDALLDRLPALLTLDLSHNRIASLVPHITAGGDRKTHTLDLSHNNISSLSGEFFGSFPRLRRLSLSFNRIGTIGNELARLTDLAELGIDNNDLVRLEASELPSSLVVLRAGHNKLTSFPAGPANLRTLDVRSNVISLIPASRITAYPHLEDLDVSGNLLSDFPNAIGGKLRKLNVSYNKLSAVPGALTIDSLPMLTDLDVSGNPIERIHFVATVRLRAFAARNISTLRAIRADAFKRLSNVDGTCINISVSNNKRLSFVHRDAFRGLDMCHLDLSGNNISHLSPSLLNSTEIRTVDVQRNPFRCNCSLQWMLDDLVPRLYNVAPGLLEDLRCATPSTFSGVRMVHWYKWQEHVFCDGRSDPMESAAIRVAGVTSDNAVMFDSSPGLLGAVGASILLLTIFVAVGLVLNQRLLRKRTRVNRRF